MDFRSAVSKILIVCTLFGASTAEARYKIPPPNPSTEFDKMDYPPVYPTYSWETLPNTEFYQVQVVMEKNSDEKIIRCMTNSQHFNRVTDWQPLTEEGIYFWQVRAIDKRNRPLSDWSEKKYFRVTLPVDFAVLGDSISHGGANFIPSGQLACQWETFCTVPVKNIARGGDTTEMMIERFDSDVLPFSPKVLLIMGGVNDLRDGKSSEEIIKNLELLREKCLSNGIQPVFGTITPMNEKILRKTEIFLTDKNWRTEREKINSWITEQGGVDVSENLTDGQGELRAELTPDGLHPELRGKKIMGEIIDSFLRKNFPNLVDRR